MKIFNLLLLSLLISSIASAQQYTFKRVSTSGYDSKLNGEISLTDSTVTINTNGIVSDFDVEIITSAENYRQYKVIFSEETDQFIRISVTIPDPRPGLKKSETGTLLYEHVDGFTGKVSTIIYYLIPK